MEQKSGGVRKTENCDAQEQGRGWDCFPQTGERASCRSRQEGRGCEGR